MRSFTKEQLTKLCTSKNADVADLAETCLQFWEALVGKVDSSARLEDELFKRIENLEKKQTADPQALQYDAYVSRVVQCAQNIVDVDLSSPPEMTRKINFVVKVSELFDAVKSYRASQQVPKHA